MGTLKFALHFPGLDQRARRPTPQPLNRGGGPSLALYPESYYGEDHRVPWRQWEKWAKDSNCSAIVGYNGGGVQVVFVATPGGIAEQQYVKHSTADWVAWEEDPYDAEKAIQTIEVPGVGRVAPVICHDGYLGSVFARYMRSGPVVFTNSSWGGVVPEKWNSVLRLRAIEHSVPVLCSMFQHAEKPLSGPFAYDANGRSVVLHRVDGESAEDFRMPGVLLGEVPLQSALPRRDALRELPHATKRLVANGPAGPYSVQFRLEDGLLAPLSTTDRSVICIRLVEEEILDYWSIFRALDQHQGVRVVFQSWWRRLPAAPEQLAHVLLGRCLENMAPFVLTDDDSIYEVVEVAGATKVMRRSRCSGSTAWVDLRYALGLRNALKMTAGIRPNRTLQRKALDLLRGWSRETPR